MLVVVPLAAPETTGLAQAHMAALQRQMILRVKVTYRIAKIKATLRELKTLLRDADLI